MGTYFLTLFLSHLLADFVFQDDAMAEKKQSENITERTHTLLVHASHFLGTSIVLFFLIRGIEWWPSFALKGLPWSVIIGLVILSVSHFVVDFLKVIIQKKVNGQHPVIVFLADQLVHLGLILGFMVYFQNSQLWNSLKLQISYLNSGVNLSLKPTHSQNILLLLCVVILTTSFANVFIKISLSSIKIKVASDEEEIKIGRLIGGVERTLTIMAVVAGSYEALAALYAAKAAIRFNDTKTKPGFAEYFILGTTISALIGILIGLFVKRYLEF